MVMDKADKKFMGNDGIDKGLSMNFAPITDSTMDEIKEEQLKTARKKSRQSYDMEATDEIIFDDLFEDSEVDMDSIVDRANMWDYNNKL